MNDDLRIAICELMNLVDLTLGSDKKVINGLALVIADRIVRLYDGQQEPSKGTDEQIRAFVEALRQLPPLTGEKETIQ